MSMTTAEERFFARLRAEITREFEAEYLELLAEYQRDARQMKADLKGLFEIVGSECTLSALIGLNDEQVIWPELLAA